MSHVSPHLYRPSKYSVCLAPVAVEPERGRHAVSKVQRRAFFLSWFDYVTEHIREKYIMYLLTKLQRGHVVIETVGRKILCYAVCYFKTRQLVVLDAVSGLWKRNGSIGIPSGDLDLQQKKIVVSHCVVIGNKGEGATMSTFLERSSGRTWLRVSNDWLKAALTDFFTRNGEIVAVPLGIALHDE